ncbi:MAG: enterotoxin [Terriglobales bacterium]
MKSFPVFAFLALLASVAAIAHSQTAALPPSLLTIDPGQAVADSDGTKLSLANRAFVGEWSTESGKFKFTKFDDRLAKQSPPVPSEVFVIYLKNGRQLPATQMSIASAPAVEDLPANPNAARLSERINGKKITVTLKSPSENIQVTWAGILRDGSNYLRQEITLGALSHDVPISEIRLIDWKLPAAKVVGTVMGSPVVGNDIFAGFEHPLSRCTVSAGVATCALSRKLPLPADHEVKYSSVIGVTLPTQMRRGFLNYVERERAHPYRTFLHYNSWYDLGYFGKFDQAGALDRINVFGTELNKLRGVVLDSFLFDDGWDDPKTLWQFNSGFPDGFTPVKQATAKYGAAPGIWLSPWGGYGKPHEERIKYGKEQGFETNKDGFALSGPKYYRHFHDVCMEMIRAYRVNQFKIDGTGNANEVIPGSEFDSDFDAAINLIKDMRAAQPDIYVNLTTGTYPSPFWLQYADSIWRGGDDHSFAGVGSWRQKWITYRDADTYQHVVKAGPLYPLNALMLHGLIYARYAKNLSTDPNHDFGGEVHDYFGTGTQLQEMYITPSLLTKENWDTIAEAAKWSRENADILRDTHWVGGDPAKLEVYGWASWSAEKAILVLRNPGDKLQHLSVDVGQAFEIPVASPTQFDAKSPWINDRSTKPLRLNAGTPYVFSLAPFEVLTLESTPVIH